MEGNFYVKGVLLQEYSNPFLKRVAFVTGTEKVTVEFIAQKNIIKAEISNCRFQMCDRRQITWMYLSGSEAVKQ